MNPDLTTIVEEVSRAHWEGARIEGEPAWHDTDKFMQASVREAMLPIVRATLDAFTLPLLTEMDNKASEIDASLDDMFDEYPDQARRMVGYRDATNWWAKVVRRGVGNV